MAEEWSLERTKESSSRLHTALNCHTPLVLITLEDLLSVYSYFPAFWDYGPAIFYNVPLFGFVMTAHSSSFSFYQYGAIISSFVESVNSCLLFILVSKCSSVWQSRSLWLALGSSLDGPSSLGRHPCSLTHSVPGTRRLFLPPPELVLALRCHCALVDSSAPQPSRMWEACSFLLRPGPSRPFTEESENHEFLLTCTPSFMVSALVVSFRHSNSFLWRKVAPGFY